MTQTLCWKCAKACDGKRCKWVESGTPIEGWDAERTALLGGDGGLYKYEIESYLVRKCPLFEGDKKKHNQHGGGMKPLQTGYLTTEGLAKHWKMGYEELKNLMSEGLPFEKDGYRRRFNISKCEKWYRTSGKQF